MMMVWMMGMISAAVAWTSGMKLGGGLTVDIAGEPHGIGFALKVILDGPLRGQNVKIAHRDNHGATKITTLGGLVEALTSREGRSR